MSSANDKGFRGLSDDFIADLQDGGFLSSLIDLIRKDSSLSLEIRHDYINVYYRGGNLLRLSKLKEHVYLPFFDDNYFRDKIGFLEGLPEKIRSVADIDYWRNKLPALKSEMDQWFSINPKAEREFQQVVVWENNNSSISNHTDYFIVDIEYDNKRGGRFDMVAIQWDSNSIARKLQGGYKPKLCFIEMKYGDSALNGKSGMLGHVKQWSEYLGYEENKKDIKEEMLNLFKQKRDLRLVGGLEGNGNLVKDFADDIDCIFLLANHDPEKSGLKNIIRELGQINIPGVGIKFCIGNFMGYGLYKENVISLPEFNKRYARQIYSKG
ncbi:MAG: hypothetical protein KJ706_05795 [Candidatus Omnitrophica bacterium]|nr:hypothetical protein [Candidatus Omnitrophota bacterium]